MTLEELSDSDNQTSPDFVIQTTPDSVTQTSPYLVNPTCNVNLTGESGTFQSPGFPNNYDNNLHCDILISVTPGKTVSVSFDEFAVEVDSDCSYDRLQVSVWHLASVFQISAYLSSTFMAPTGIFPTYILILFTISVAIPVTIPMIQLFMESQGLFEYQHFCFSGWLRSSKGRTCKCKHLTGLWPTVT